MFVSEEEQIPPLLSKEQPKSKWDDEDVDENDVKESWEDEDEPTPVWLIKNYVDDSGVASIFLFFSFLFSWEGI